MARDVVVIIMIIAIVAAIPEIIGGIVDFFEGRFRRGRRDDGADEKEAP